MKLYLFYFFFKRCSMPLMKTEKNTCVLIVQIKVETPEYTLTNIKDYLKILYLQSLLKNIYKLIILKI